MQVENDDNESFGFLQKLFIAAIFITVILIPTWACITRNLQREPAAVVIGPKPLTVAPVETPSPYTILIERAKAAATVEIIKANADAHSQGTDDEIRLRWNVHFMRRWWALFAVPVGVIFAGLLVYLWGLRYGRK